ncbi:MAG: hypothetical protein FWF79_09935 [Defluviitaleaceae bacterium]|nr:hypothetical protein [Defluviitaleaceae bacterium]
MDFGTMFALGMFDSDEEKNEGSLGMTDYQFKAFVKMCLVVAENTTELKEFKRRIAVTHGSPYQPFVEMLINISEATGNMEKVRQVIQDILKATS